MTISFYQCMGGDDPLFGVLRVVIGSRQGAASRMIERIRKKKWLSTEGGREGMSVYFVFTVELPENASPKLEKYRVEYALGLLRRRGVRRTVAPVRYRSMLEGFVMAAVHPGQALQACIPQAVQSFARSGGLPLSQICVRVRGRRMNRDIAAGVLAMAPHTRTVHLDFAQRDLGLERRLLEEYGIAARGPMPKDATEVVVLMEGAPPPNKTVLDLTGEDRPEAFLPRLACGGIEAPAGVNGNDFFTALYLDGGIEAAALEVCFVEPRPAPEKII